MIEGEINDPFGEFFVEMNPSIGDEKLWTVSWTQPYVSWPKPQPEPMLEPEIEDFAQAREVLARIMAK